MYRCKILKSESFNIYNGKGDIVFTNPKCGHVQTTKFSLPYYCQDPNCNEVIPSVDKLVGQYSQDNRVKFFAEGKL